MHRTERDNAILHALTFKVRLLSLDQIAMTWWGAATAPKSKASSRLSKLCAARLLERRTVLAHPILDFRGPALSWQVGESDPNMEPVSYHLKSRWTTTASPTSVLVATTKTRNQLGGVGWKPRRAGSHKIPATAAKLSPLGQETHDLHTAEVYLRFLRTPELPLSWLGEDAYHLLSGSYRPQRGEKTPDAMLLDDSGTPVRLVEFAGSYPADRLRDFHEHAKRLGLPYELW